MVTGPVTLVNIMFADFENNGDYQPRTMNHPNRLDELMRLKGINGVEMARVANTTKQQIHKLRLGERKLTREWAERLAPVLGVTWPEVMGWTGPLPIQAPDPGPLRRGVGTRIQWMRVYRELGVEEAARRFGMSVQRLAAIEAGEVDLTVSELATISGKLQAAVAWLLQGIVDELPYRIAVEWEEYTRSLQSQRSMRTG